MGMGIGNVDPTSLSRSLTFNLWLSFESLNFPPTDESSLLFPPKHSHQSQLNILVHHISNSIRSSISMCIPPHFSAAAAVLPNALQSVSSVRFLCSPSLCNQIGSNKKQNKPKKNQKGGHSGSSRRGGAGGSNPFLIEQEPGGREFDLGFGFGRWVLCLGCEFLLGFVLEPQWCRLWECWWWIL